MASICQETRASKTEETSQRHARSRSITTSKTLFKWRQAQAADKSKHRLKSSSQMQSQTIKLNQDAVAKQKNLVITTARQTSPSERSALSWRAELRKITSRTIWRRSFMITLRPSRLGSSRRADRESRIICKFIKTLGKFQTTLTNTTNSEKTRRCRG